MYFQNNGAMVKSVVPQLLALNANHQLINKVETKIYSLCPLPMPYHSAKYQLVLVIIKHNVLCHSILGYWGTDVQTHIQSIILWLPILLGATTIKNLPKIITTARMQSVYKYT